MRNIKRSRNFSLLGASSSFLTSRSLRYFGSFFGIGIPSVDYLY
jgi:hypothetical protein